VALVLVAGCTAPTITIVRTQPELQQAVARHFPLTVSRPMASVVLTDPIVVLRDGDDRLGLDVNVSVKLPVVPAYAGRVAVMARPFYDPAEKAFYLRDARIERLDLPGLTGERRAALSAAISALGAPALAKIPVYRLEGRNLEEVTARHFLKEVRIEGGRLRLTLGPGGSEEAAAAAREEGLRPAFTRQEDSPWLPARRSASR
jgi:hypothetical protein